MKIETKADFARALERLRRREAESLAAFILSLAQDSGPIGEQVRTFIVVEADAVAMENCGDHEFEVTSAFERAAELIGRVSKEMPQAEVVAALEALLEDDGYGVRGHLAEVIASRGEDP